jgi:large subunit ribosomal protein L14e
MASLEIGRVCMKIAGREAGKYCVVVKKINDAFVEVTGPKILTGVKRRRANIEHLEPLEYILQISDSAADEDVVSALESANLMTKLGLKKPSAAAMKAEKAKPKEVKQEVKKEEKKDEKVEKKETKQKEEKPKKEAKEKKEKKK